MSPLGYAVRLIDGEKCDRHLLQPADGVAPSHPLRRHIQQPVGAFPRPAHHLRLLRFAERAVQDRRRNPHLRQLRRLILHQRDQRRNHHRRSFRNYRRQLIAKRLATARRHHHASIVPGQQALDNTLLQRTKRAVAPVPPQRRQQIRFHTHDLRSISRGECKENASLKFGAGYFPNREPRLTLCSPPCPERSRGVPSVVKIALLRFDTLLLDKPSRTPPTPPPSPQNTRRCPPAQPFHP